MTMLDQRAINENHMGGKRKKS